VGDAPARDVPYELRAEGFVVIARDVALYQYIPSDKRIVPLALDLPECQVQNDSLVIGGNVFIGNTIVGAPVGFAVSEEGISIGAQLPSRLAKLVSPASSDR
jgi:hypothetical protein